MATETAAQAAGRLSEAAVERTIAGLDAGHRMAGLEPDDFDRELARRQLRGEVTAELAVQLSVARAQRSG